MKTSKKGISLIVLIITILVMIIIAAAVILYLDDSKVIKNAKKAVTMNNVSVAKEVVTVARAEWRANQEKIKDDGYKTFVKYAEYKLEEAGFIIGTNGGEVEVSENGLLYAYVQPIIPEGYIASDIDGEDTVAEGLVIYEGDETVSKDEDAKTTRNQFVWVPVPNMTEFVRKDWIGSAGLSSNYNLGITGDAFANLTSYNLDNAEEEAEYNSMKESVAKYGGFYIARYEAGNDNGKVVSIKGADVYKDTWNNIKLKSKELSTGSLVSHLIYGEEWDAALAFISQTDPTYPTYITNSSGNGNPRNNIYSLSGQTWEFTQECKPGYYGVYRGGTTSSSTSVGTFTLHAAGLRLSSNSDLSQGFRVALYLK